MCDIKPSRPVQTKPTSIVQQYWANNGARCWMRILNKLETKPTNEANRLMKILSKLKLKPTLFNINWNCVASLIQFKCMKYFHDVSTLVFENTQCFNSISEPSSELWKTRFILIVWTGLETLNRIQLAHENGLTREQP
jgi:hypothetical protein